MSIDRRPTSVPGDLDDLRRRVAGPVLTPTDAGYADEIAGFDLAVPRHPAVVVGATGADDVVEGIRHARRSGRGVAVRATGHGVVDGADDALLLTTGRATGVRVDPAGRTARLAAGATWSHVLREAAPFGLAPLAGSAPAVGAVSYTLGGGVGVLGRRWGFSADHVRRLDLVTADGVLRHVTADEHADLFWAVRGGGGNFGVVTGLEIALVELRTVYGGGLYFPGEAAADVLAALVTVGRDLPDEISLSAAVLRFPDVAALPAALRGRWRCHVRVTSTGDPAACEAHLAALRGVTSPVLDTVRVMPVTDIGTIHADPVTPRATNSRSLVLRALDEGVVAALARHAGPRSPFVLELRLLGGALAREPAVPNAVGHRRGAATVYATAYPRPGGPTAADAAEESALLADLAPWSDGGALVNFLIGPRVTPADVAAAYEPELWTRLVEVKTRWDPDNVFRSNHNVPPRGGPA